MYRVDHNIIFEELKQMDKNTNSLSTILEKDSMFILHNSLGNYWIYHKNVVEDPSEEKVNPADKAWLIVKYVANNQGYNVKVRILL